jgi:branched-chain amino acid transport system permease protein
MAFFAALVVDGTLAGAVYALVALAFVVVYKASRMINFALGEWVMVASRLVAAGLYGLGLGLGGALGLALAGVIVLALGFNRLVLRRMVGRPLISLIMVTIGLGSFLRGAAALLFAGVPGRIPLPLPQEPLALHGVPVAADRLAAAVIAALCIAGVTWLFTATRTGVALRALADDPQAAMAAGVDVHRHFAIAWGLMGALCIAAGTLWASVAGGGFGLVVVGLKVFPVVVIGGLDSLGGTIVAAIAIGVLESLAAGYLDPVLGAGFSTVASYVALIVTLCLRPWGLFGRPQIARV